MLVKIVVKIQKAAIGGQVENKFKFVIWVSQHECVVWENKELLLPKFLYANMCAKEKEINEPFDQVNGEKNTYIMTY